MLLLQSIKQTHSKAFNTQLNIETRSGSHTHILKKSAHTETEINKKRSSRLILNLFSERARERERKRERNTTHYSIQKEINKKNFTLTSFAFLIVTISI